MRRSDCIETQVCAPSMHMNDALGAPWGPNFQVSHETGASLIQMNRVGQLHIATVLPQSHSLKAHSGLLIDGDGERGCVRWAIVARCASLVTGYSRKLSNNFAVCWKLFFFVFVFVFVLLSVSWVRSFSNGTHSAAPG
ncbi:hypothetical protein M758_4G056900 [Ceratodon purpureus]|nr:hypothetical protein M758_4G056900 [Ceratodon purpureus]